MGFFRVRLPTQRLIHSSIWASVRQRNKKLFFCGFFVPIQLVFHSDIYIFKTTTFFFTDFLKNLTLLYRAFGCQHGPEWETMDVLRIQKRRIKMLPRMTNFLLIFSLLNATYQSIMNYNCKYFTLFVI